MIGFIVKAKVARFIKTRRAEKVLVTKKFLTALDAEIERVIVLSTEKLVGDCVSKVAITIPKRKIGDRLICDQRVKERVRQAKSDMTVTKTFLTDLNTYAGAVILTSMELVKGAYMEQLAIGEATATVASRKMLETDALPQSVEPPQATVTANTAIVFEAALPREAVEVTYELCVQKAILACRLPIFTGKTTARIEEMVTKMAQRYLTLIGITDPATVRITGVIRKGDVHNPNQKHGKKCEK